MVTELPIGPLAARPASNSAQSKGVAPQQSSKTDTTAFDTFYRDSGQSEPEQLADEGASEDVVLEKESETGPEAEDISVDAATDPSQEVDAQVAPVVLDTAPAAADQKATLVHVVAPVLVGDGETTVATSSDKWAAPQGSPVQGTQDMTSMQTSLPEKAGQNAASAIARQNALSELGQLEPVKYAEVTRSVQAAQAVPPRQEIPGVAPSSAAPQVATAPAQEMLLKQTVEPRTTRDILPRVAEAASTLAPTIPAQAAVTQTAVAAIAASNPSASTNQNGVMHPSEAFETTSDLLGRLTADGAASEIGLNATGSDQKSSSATAPTFSAVASQDSARSIGQQIVERLMVRQDGRIEMGLNPEELGRVRVSMSLGDGGVVVAIAAERPETMDLMRRHIDQLADQFRALGYGSVDFSFEQQTPDQQTAQNGGGAPLERVEESDDQMHTVRSLSLSPSGLDWRL